MDRERQVAAATQPASKPAALAGPPAGGAADRAGENRVNTVSRVSPDAMEMARSLLAEMEAEGRLRSACELLRHVAYAEFVEEEMEEVRRRAGYDPGICQVLEIRANGGLRGHRSQNDDQSKAFRPNGC